MEQNATRQEYSGTHPLSILRMGIVRGESSKMFEQGRSQWLVFPSIQSLNLETLELS